MNYVATDLYSRYISEQLAEMTKKEFALYLDYHFSVCERQDMVGITSHSLDIFKKK